MKAETRALLDRLIRLVEAVQVEQRAIKAMLEGQQRNALIVGPIRDRCSCQVQYVGTVRGITVDPHCPSHSGTYTAHTQHEGAMERAGFGDG